MYESTSEPCINHVSGSPPWSSSQHRTTGLPDSQVEPERRPYDLVVFGCTGTLEEKWRYPQSSSISRHGFPLTKKKKWDGFSPELKSYPFRMGLDVELNHSVLGVPPFMETPMWLRWYCLFCIQFGSLCFFPCFWLGCCWFVAHRHDVGRLFFDMAYLGWWRWVLPTDDLLLKSCHPNWFPANGVIDP